MFPRRKDLSDREPRYSFTCPNCSGSLSILLERIPPVQARFRCPHCSQPMDFPSRDEARVYVSLQAKESSLRDAPAGGGGDAGAEGAEAGESTASGKRFSVQKPGFEGDLFDRRAIRDLIRTGELLEHDPVRLGEGKPIPARDVPELKSLFDLKKKSALTPPRRCRAHTDRVAHFVCADGDRPLCDDCAQEKKFGGTTLRVCAHCGGVAKELETPAS